MSSFHLLTRRNAAIFLAAFFLVTGFGMGNRAVVGLGEFLFVVLALQFAGASDLLEQVRAERHHTPRAFQDQDVDVALDVHNEGKRPLHLLMVWDSFPPSGSYRIAQLAPLLADGTQARFEYQQTCSRRRGLYVLGPVKMQVFDTLGLFAFSRDANAITNLIVYPKAPLLPAFDALGRGVNFSIGEEIARRVGHSEEFSGLRAYRRGDPPRLIHWPTSARLGGHFIKEFDESVVTEVTIFCDLFLLSLAGLGSVTSIEYRISAAISIAEAAIRRQHLVRVVAAKQPVEATRMAGGSAHLLQILDWLALLRTEGSGSFEEVLAAEARSVRRGATAVLVLSSVHMKLAELVGAVRGFQFYGVRVIAVVIEDRSFFKLRTEQEHAFANAPAQDRIIATLRAAGCTVYTVVNQEDLVEALTISA